MSLPTPSAAATASSASAIWDGVDAAAPACGPNGLARNRLASSSSPAITWTLMSPERRTRSWTTEPCRISNQRERVDLPMTIWVTLLASA